MNQALRVDWDSYKSVYCRLGFTGCVWWRTEYARTLDHMVCTCCTCQTVSEWSYTSPRIPENFNRRIISRLSRLCRIDCCRCKECQISELRRDIAMPLYWLSPEFRYIHAGWVFWSMPKFGIEDTVQMLRELVRSMFGPSYGGSGCWGDLDLGLDSRLEYTEIPDTQGQTLVVRQWDR